MRGGREGGSLLFILCLLARELDLANKTEELGRINDTNKSHQEKVQTESYGPLSFLSTPFLGLRAVADFGNKIAGAQVAPQTKRNKTGGRN